MRYHPPFAQYLVSQGLLDNDPFSLVDVGASGGIERHWHVFGGALRAWGFDPLIAEVSRLNSIQRDGHISYHAFRITDRRKSHRDQERPSDKLTLKDNQPFARTSAARAISVLEMNYAREFYDPTGSGLMADEETSLDEFFAGVPHPSVDFIKIDTDGADFEVLRDAEKLVADSPTLGIFIEIQFHGPVRPDANLFCNIDGFLRERGFSLFDIDVYRYSRATLPKPFADNIPAQTHEGQVLWGDALYLRDAGDPDYDRMWGVSMAVGKVLKLAAIQEIYGLEDCAAEVLCKYSGIVDKLIDVEHCLNLLTPVFLDRKATFREYREAFRRNPRQWFPEAQGKREPRPPEPKVLPAERDLVVIERLATQEEQRPTLEEQRNEIARLRQEVAGWQGFWRAVEDTAGWRLLCAWRRIRDRLAPEGTWRRRLYDLLVGPVRGGRARNSVR
jgi:hypothetical protein